MPFQNRALICLVTPFDLWFTNQTDPEVVSFGCVGFSLEANDLFGSGDPIRFPVTRHNFLPS